MKMIIAGSRTCGKIADNQWDYPKLIAAIDKIVKEKGLEITLVISGGAKGPDIAGEMWATQNGIPFESVKPDWSKGRGAGLFRNMQMADQGEGVIALYDGSSRGTKHMINTMRDLGKVAYVEIIK